MPEKRSQLVSGVRRGVRSTTTGSNLNTRDNEDGGEDYSNMRDDEDEGNGGRSAKRKRTLPELPDDSSEGEDDSVHTEEGVQPVDLTAPRKGKGREVVDADSNDSP